MTPNNFVSIQIDSSIIHKKMAAKRKASAMLHKVFKSKNIYICCVVSVTNISSFLSAQNETFNKALLGTHEMRSSLLARTPKLSPLVSYKTNPKSFFFPWSTASCVPILISFHFFCRRHRCRRRRCRHRRRRSGYYYVCLVSWYAL